MGMFDKDKEIGLIITNFVQIGEEFVIWGGRITHEAFPTSLGPAVQAELDVSKLRSPGERYKVTTLASAITSKVREASSDDFPAIVQLDRVATKWGKDALVMRYLKPFGTAHADPMPARSVDEDIPF